jgi:hypothetical protein
MFILSGQAFAINNANEPVTTEPPPYAGYEIIQTSRAMRETYLLNRYSGETWQLVSSRGRAVWQQIPVEPNDGDIVPKEIDGPVYQISISGLAARGTYLINTFSGATWILYEDPDEGIF